MGKAARVNVEARQAWIASLTRQENLAREAAELLLSRFILPAGATGMCYRMTFFLHLYLAEKGISSLPVVGWVTDGRDDIAMSHAWLALSGKKIDLTLTNVDPSLAAIAGETLILDRPVRKDTHYSYFLNKEDRHFAADKLAASTMEIRRLLDRKLDEHAQMVKRAADAKEMRRFLDAAPDGLTFERLKEKVFRNPE